MTSNNCPTYSSCSAPICPLDPGRGCHQWFADESICTAQKPGGEASPAWIGVQRRIARATRDPDRGYWTVAMLESAWKVSRSIRGVDPDSGREEEAISNWIAARKKPAALSPERVAELKARIRGFLSKRRLPTGASSTPPSQQVSGEGPEAAPSAPAVEGPQDAQIQGEE